MVDCGICTRMCIYVRIQRKCAILNTHLSYSHQTHPIITPLYQGVAAGFFGVLQAALDPLGDKGQFSPRGYIDPTLNSMHHVHVAIELSGQRLDSSLLNL